MCGVFSRVSKNGIQLSLDYAAFGYSLLRDDDV